MVAWTQLIALMNFVSQGGLIRFKHPRRLMFLLLPYGIGSVHKGRLKHSFCFYFFFFEDYHANSCWKRLAALGLTGQCLNYVFISRTWDQKSLYFTDLLVFNLKKYFQGKNIFWQNSPNFANPFVDFFWYLPNFANIFQIFANL